MNPLSNVQGMILSGLIIFLLIMPQQVRADSPTIITSSDNASLDAKAYSAFLIGQVAASESDLDRAISSYNKLITIESKDYTLRDRAFLLSLLNGDMDTAMRVSPGQKAQSVTTKNLSLLLKSSSEIRDRPQSALKGIHAMLALDPDLPVARLSLPIILAQKGQIKKAIDPEAMGLADLDSEKPLLSFFLRLNMAMIAESASDKASKALAKTYYEELYSLSPAAMSLMGMDYAAYLERQGDIIGSIKIYDALGGMGSEEAKARSRLVKLTEAAPPKKSYRSMVAASYMVAAQMAARDQEQEMAIIYAYFSQWIDASPDQRLFFLADMQTKMKQPEKAMSSLARLHESHPRYVDALLLRRQISLDQSINQKEGPEAQNLLAEAVSLAPNAPTVVYERAVSLLQAKKFKEGIDYLEAYQKQSGADALGWQGYYLLASFYEKQNQWDRSVKLITEAIRLAPDQPIVLNFYGYGLINRNLEVEKGLELVQKALELMPQNGAIMDSKAWGHYRLGEHEKALETIESAILLEPVDPEITEHLGDIYLALGRKNEAGWAYERSLGYLEIDSDHKPVIEAKLKAINEPNSLTATAKGKASAISPANKLKTSKK